MRTTTAGDREIGRRKPRKTRRTTAQVRAPRTGNLNATSRRKIGDAEGRPTEAASLRWNPGERTLSCAPVPSPDERRRFYQWGEAGCLVGTLRFRSDVTRSIQRIRLY